MQLYKQTEHALHSLKTLNRIFNFQEIIARYDKHLSSLKHSLL